MSFMKSFLLLTLLFFGGCYQRANEPTGRSAKTNTSTASEQQAGFIQQQPASGPQFEKVSLNQADQSQSMAEAMNRKIIRNAELQLEIRDPAEGQRKITSIAESLGGFVVTSESKQSDTQDPTKKELEVNLVVRIPATQYDSALQQIRAVSNRVINEKTNGQDVTESSSISKRALKRRRRSNSSFSRS